MNIRQLTPIEETFALAERIPSYWRDLRTGAAIRNVRKALHLTQREVASAADISQSHLARLEAGMECRLSTLTRVFAAMGCDLIPIPRARESFARMQSRNYDRRLDRWFARSRARRQLNRF